MTEKKRKNKRIISFLTASVIFLISVIGIIPIQTDAASSSEIRKQINVLKEQKSEIEDRIKEVQAQYQANEDEIADIIAKKNVIDQEIGLLSAEIANINEQITSFNTLIADKQDELDSAQNRYEELCEENTLRVRTMEEEGAVSYWEVLFQANSFTDLLDRLNMVEEIAAADKRRLVELSEAAQKVENAKIELENEKADLEAIKLDMDATQTELDTKRAEADSLIQELLEKAEDLEALQAEFQEQEEAFLTEIAAKEKEYTQAKAAEWAAYMATYTTVTPETSAANSRSTTNNSTPVTAPSGGTWLRPCSYTYMSSPFGYRQSPTSGASTYHQAVDLAAPAMTPIYATRAGQVTTARYSNSAGNYVSINHMDGFASIYMHMTSYVVSAGQTVSAGQLIGYVGKTGIATGNHLHFGISYNGVYVNPAQYVSF